MITPVKPKQEDIIHSWHERAHAYHELIERWPLFTDMVYRLLEFVPKGFQGHALDIAGGTGLLSKCLLKKYPSAYITLVEPAENMRALALQELGDQIDILNATSDSLNSLGIIADAALCSASFHLMNEATVLPAIASVLRNGAVFATNCWGHSFDEAVELNQKVDWMQYVDHALSEFDQPLLKRPLNTPPNIKNAKELSSIARNCGLDLIETKIITTDINSSFNIEFTAMDNKFLSHVNPEIREQVIIRAQELCQGIDTISSVDLCFKKIG